MFQEIINNNFLLASIINPASASIAWQEIVINSAFLISGFANFFLALYVYRKNPHESINKSFFYFGCVLFLWCLTGFLSSFTKNIFWLRASYGAGSLVVVSGLFFCSTLSGKKIKRSLKILIIVLCAILFYLCLFTPFIVEKLLSYGATGYDAVLGRLFFIWGFHQIIISLVLFYILFSSLRHVEERRKKQILYFILGAVIFAFWSLLVAVILPFFGFTGLSNIDSPSTIFMVAFTSYSIIRYNLMDIRSLFFLAFIDSLIIVAIIAFLLLLVFVSSFLFQRMLMWPIYALIVVVSIILFFIGRLFFIEKTDLEEAKADLTDALKKSEENRIKAETERDKTATIISNFSDGLILLDENDKIFSINPRAEKLLSLEAGKLLNRPFHTLADFPLAVPIRAVLKTGLKGVPNQQIELAKNFTIELSVIPLNLNKKDIGHLIVLHDISREKTVEKMKTEFVSLAAHQLKTPLSIIKWSMSMLKGGDFGKLNKKQTEVVQNTFKNNQRLIFLVNDLLNVTRIEEGTYLYKVVMTSMKEVVDSVVDTYKDEIKKRKVKINFSCQDNLPETMLDAEKMKLVVQNLIDNAMKYSPGGGTINVVLESDGENIKFTVQDFGIGISHGQQDKIFTKFFRGDNAAKVSATGTGLGLFMVRNIVEAHGGKIWFESKENLGTSFHLTLPIKKKPV